MPDFSKMEPSVRQQMQTQFSSLKSAIGKASSTRGDLARAYGETGKLLMAAALLDAAEVCYVNAQTLAPDDSRWPYYLGHVYKGKGPIEKSVSSFERARQLAPDDVATMVWLGDAYLSAGNADGADQLFARRSPCSLQSPPRGLARAERHWPSERYRRAVDQLNEALALEPQATSIHYPLAMAYRGLGDVTQSDAHLAQQGKVESEARRSADARDRRVASESRGLQPARRCGPRGRSLGSRRRAVPERTRARAERAVTAAAFWDRSLPDGRQARRRTAVRSRCRERRPTTRERTSASACCSTTPANTRKRSITFRRH